MGWIPGYGVLAHVYISHTVTPNDHYTQKNLHHAIFNLAMQGQGYITHKSTHCVWVGVGVCSSRHYGYLISTTKVSTESA